ncbi:MAG: hypothetical protein EA351_04580 [Gemmatimonadales bacterium]|nr:MAG: hypothetical protein EA351_04580 [Gemmatimonadales bacterium]
MRRSIFPVAAVLPLIATFVAFPSTLAAAQNDAGAAVGMQAHLLSSQFNESGHAAVGGDRVRELARARLQEDFRAMSEFRPGYPFWQHIFTIPDGSVAFGSGVDGRLLAVFPNGGDWTRDGRWEDASLSQALRGQRLESRLSPRRDQVAELLEGAAGPVLHNATRGRFLLPNVRAYGSFLEEWGHIYERFGVPAEIGIAQAILESGLNGTVRSEAGAIGFCQWLPANWNRMKQISPFEIEGHNQTTQAAYCAAYLTILATKYGSFIPALSEHHAGGSNVGRTVINGSRLGGETMREQYFLGAEFARDLRTISPTRFREVVRSYGPRSFLYAEMVFGNTYNVTRLTADIPQQPVHAMRAARNLPLADIAQRTGLSVDELRRYNPALVRQVPRGAALYLPFQVDAFGPDIAFWHRPADPDFAAVLTDFLQVDRPLIEWEDPGFAAVLREFRTRFLRTQSEEGIVMATVLAYVIGESYTGARSDILAEFRTDPNILRLVQDAIRERESLLGASLTAR